MTTDKSAEPGKVRIQFLASLRRDGSVTVVNALLKHGADGDATFSTCERYRYALNRDLSCHIDDPRLINRGLGREPGPEYVPLAEGEKPRTALFIMLNPSTADENVLDPTLRRCRGFAVSWRCHRMMIGNVFAWRSTDPAQLADCMRRGIDPTGEYNHDFIAHMAREADIVCYGWGAYSYARDAAKKLHARLLDIGVKPQALGLTTGGNNRQGRGGMPRHPLYLRRDSTLAPFTFPKD